MRTGDYSALQAPVITPMFFGDKALMAPSHCLRF
jgi:hypothetical protein